MPALNTYINVHNRLALNTYINVHNRLYRKG